MGNKTSKENVPHNKVSRKKSKDKKKDKNQVLNPEEVPMENDNVYIDMNDQINRKRFVALNDYEDEYIKFYVGDFLVTSESYDELNQKTITAMIERNGEEVTVPLNYLRIVGKFKYDDVAGYFEGLDRHKASRLLQVMNIPVGSYVIRLSGNGKDLALSVRVKEEEGVYDVKHFLIHNDNDQRYYLDEETPFENLNALINYYKKNNNFIQTNLTKPAPRDPPEVSFEEFEVSRKNFTMITELGNGNFGTVHKARWGVRSNNFVAIKVVKAGQMSPAEFIDEAKKMHKLRHDNIVKLLAISTLPIEEDTYIVTEFMSNGDLLKFIRSSQGNKVKYEEMIGYMSQICKGMSYLEGQNFVHRDLRACNILVDGLFNMKVADFGLSLVVQDDSACIGNKAKFPVKWTAPEVVKTSMASTKSDVWSFGIVCYEIVTYGQTPYKGLKNEEVHREVIINDRYRMPSPHNTVLINKSICNCPEDLYSLMQHCWKTDPRDRPTFESLQETFGDWDVQISGNYS